MLSYAVLKSVFLFSNFKNKTNCCLYSLLKIDTAAELAISSILNFNLPEQHQGIESRLHSYHIERRRRFLEERDLSSCWMKQTSLSRDWMCWSRPWTAACHSLDFPHGMWLAAFDLMLFSWISCRHHYLLYRFCQCAPCIALGVDWTQWGMMHCNDHNTSESVPEEYDSNTANKDR